MEKQIIDDLQQRSDVALKEKFRVEQEKERMAIREEKEGRRAYDSLIKHNDGLLCFVYYKSTSRFSLAEAYQRSKRHIEAFKTKGVKFVFVSFDYNRDFWKDYISKNGLSNELNTRIGAIVDDDKYHVKRIIDFPQYVVFHKRKLVDDDAPPVDTDDFFSVVRKHLD